MSIEAALIAAAGLITGALITGVFAWVIGPWWTHHLALKKDAEENRLWLEKHELQGVKEDNQELERSVRSLTLDRDSQQKKAERLLDHKRRLRRSVVNHRIAGDKLLGKLMGFNPDKNWSEITLECGWPPVPEVDQVTGEMLEFP